MRQDGCTCGSVPMEVAHLPGCPVRPMLTREEVEATWQPGSTWGLSPPPPTYVNAPPFTFEDKERLFRQLDRIVQLLEVLTGVRR